MKILLFRSSGSVPLNRMVSFLIKEHHLSGIESDVIYSKKFHGHYFVVCVNSHKLYHSMVTSTTNNNRSIFAGLSVRSRGRRG